MSRSLLLVICDFLLLSLLALGRFEEPEEASGPGPRGGEYQAEARTVGAEMDLIEVLKVSLEVEQTSRDTLAGELAETQSALEAREAALRDRETRLDSLSQTLVDREAALADRDSSLRQTEEQLRLTESERQALAQRSEELAARSQTLEERLAERERRERELQASLGETRQRADLNEERLKQAEAALRERLSQLEERENRLASLQSRQEELERQERELSRRLDLSEQEKTLIRDNLATARREVEIVREEKDRLHVQASELARGVGALAEQSEALTREIRRSAPISPNRIFQLYQENRLDTVFTAYRESLFFRHSRDRVTSTILVSDGIRLFALLHIDDIPLDLREPSQPFSRLQGEIQRDGRRARPSQLYFLDADPRVLLAPLTENEWQALGSGRVYPLSPDPFNHQEVIIISSDGSAYGESQFRLNPEHPSYVRMERSTIRALFGDFTPRRGDLVFSKADELIGIMVNSDYCLLLENFLHTATLPLGEETSRQDLAAPMERMAQRLSRLPFRIRQ